MNIGGVSTDAAAIGMRACPMLLIVMRISRHRLRGRERRILLHCLRFVLHATDRLVLSLHGG
jgi:hypothetical protein